MLKLRPTIAYKKDRVGTGFLFSLGDNSNQLVKISGLLNEIVQLLTEGKDFQQVKQQILQDYEVDEVQLMKDIAGFEARLTELDFLEK